MQVTLSGPGLTRSMGFPRRAPHDRAAATPETTRYSQARTGFRWALVTGLGAATIASGPATAATLTGVLVLQERGQPAVDLAGAMVYFTPEAGVHAPAPPVAAEIVVRDRRFGPRTIAVPVGSQCL